jgi:uncharacterized cupredoxin-like copper-binding protein
MRTAVVVGVVVAWLGMGGCGSSQRAGGGMAATRVGDRVIVPVELDDYVIRMPATVPAGEAVFEVKNVGHHTHNIRVAGGSVDAGLDENLEGGQSATLTVRLSPGRYRVTCPVGPHATMGMRLWLTVEE